MVGNVCRKDHVEVLAAQEREIPLESFPSLFGKLFLQDAANRGGRSSSPARTARRPPRRCWRTCCTDAGRDPSFLIGGVPLNFRQSWRLGAGAEFVVEGDEYDTAFFDKGSKFLHYRPQIVLLTSVEFDHADIFRDEEAVRAAFRKFVALIPEDGLLVACAASPGAMEVARGARSQVDDVRAARLGRRLDVRGRRRARPAGGPRWRWRGGASASSTSTRTCPASTTTRTWSA